MRSAFVTAVFAASVLAVPHQKRAVVTNTDVEVVYVTEYYTVTGGQAAPTEAAEPAPTPKQQYQGGHWGHNPHWWGGKPNKGNTKEPKPTTTKTHIATWEPAPTPSPTTSTTQAAAPTGGSGGNAPAGYPATVIKHHNIHRSNHSASAIQWDSSLEASAKQVAGSCVYAHNTDVGNEAIGQNIAAGVDNDGIDKVITNMFYNNEEPLYAGLYGQDSPDMSNFESWGHFSQIVWKNTERVGCYTQYCPNGLGNVGSNVSPYFTVCNYAPPGNFANEYGSNVGEPLGDATVVAS